MIIAIPVVDGKLSAHFGHCETFALFDTDPENRTIRSEEQLPAPAHEPGALPRWLADKGAELIIAGGMGMRAQELFKQRNISVVVGAPSHAPDAVVNAYLQGTLATGDNLCDH